MAEFDGAEHLGFGDLLGTGLHHHNAVFGACHNDVQFGLAAFGIGRIGEILAVPHAHADAPENIGKGDIRDGQSGSSAGDGERVGILFGIGGKDHGDDLSLVEEPLRKQRTDGAIDQAAGQNLFFGGTALTFDQAARDFAGGVGIFTIIDGEREESGSRFGLVGHASGDEDDRVPGANDNSAVRLFGHFSSFQADFAASQINFNDMQHSL